MNTAYNGTITLVLLAFVLLPLVLGAYFNTPDVKEAEEFDGR
jgi:hypothetical protein